jgi:hypothetical protein
MKSTSRKRPEPNAKIEKGKIKRIWGCASALGIDESLLRSIVFEISNSDSISALTNAQGDAVIRHLQTLLARQNRNDYLHAKRDGVVPLEHWRRSPDQDALLDDLLQKINSGAPKINLESMCQRMFKKERAKLNRREAQAVIEALKSIYKRGA